MRYRSLLLITTALVLFAASGCMRMEVDLVINDNDTVDGSIVAAWSEEFLEEAESADIDFDPDSADDLIDALLNDLPGIEDRREYQQDGYVGEAANFSRQPLEDFSDMDEGQYDLQIVRVDGNYELTGYWDLRGFDPLEFDLDADVASPDMTLSVTFPGRIIDHNGSVDGRTITWDLELGEENELVAEASARNPGVMVASFGLGAVVILAALWVWQYRQLRHYSL